MSYNVNFDALDSFYYSTRSQCDSWSEQLKTLEGAINALQTSSNMSGASADSIRAYFESVHIVILGLLGQLIALHSYNSLLYKQDYNTNIDTDLHAVIKSSELSDIISQIKGQRQLALTVDDTVAYALNGIRDIFSISYRDIADVDLAHGNIIDDLTILDENITALEQRHTASDFTTTEEMISSLTMFINELRQKGRTYKTGFTAAALSTSASFSRLHDAYLDISSEIEQKAPSIQAAIDNENDRISRLQTEYEQRQKEATVINWVVAGVCIIGSIAAIAATGGAATPLVVGTVSAVSGAVMTGTNNLTSQYVENGSLENADWGSFGKDVLIGGVTGFVTGYVGAGVSGAVSSGLTNTAVGNTLLNSSSTAVRVGANAVVGSASQIVSGVATRGTSTFVSSIIVTGGDISTSINTALDSATDGQQMLFDAAIGGVTGGMKGLKKPTAVSQDNIFKDGEQFNEDGSLKSNIKYTSGEHDYLYETDKNGLISHVEVDDLQYKTHEGRLQHNSNTLGKEVGDDAGHLIGDRFGGSPDLDNLVSQDSHLNRSEYKAMENIWDDALSQNKEVTVSIDVNYPHGSSRPSGFDVTYTIDGEEFNWYFNN